ncbi:MAG: carotenoid biosynthesis protein [Methyloceanibacter sp.]
MNANQLLWGLVALFAIETVVGSLYPHLAITVLQLATMIAFVFLHGSLRYGVEGIAAFAVFCLVVSNIFENLGVATGFPFGPYHYTDVLGPKLFYVPLMVGPAYLAVGYMAWVLATILVGDVRRGADAFSTFATPVIATFIMVLWDLSMDPTAATVLKFWIWEGGGGFFGVPISNYFGWFLTVYVFMQLFALYLRVRAPMPERPQPKSYFMQAIAMYALVALSYVLTFLTKESAPVTDPTGAVWRSGDIFETAAITSLFTMIFVAALAAIQLMRDTSSQSRAR